MEKNIDPSYPGTNASPQELIFLANEYERAANSLFDEIKRGVPLSRAPAYLCAIHAIELFLNAFLLDKGSLPEHIRSYQHNLAEKWYLADQSGLLLKKKTIGHLSKLTKNREYLVSRYGPELTDSLSQITRLSATLNEISKKVTSYIPEEPSANNKNAA